jgi:hypothetical protein
VGKLGKRIGEIEELVGPGEALGDWTLWDQIEDVLESLSLWRISGPGTGHVTDRQIKLLACLHAYLENGAPGEFQLPASGARGKWSFDENDEPVLNVEGRPLLEDLPERTAKYLKRMDTQKQPAHERFMHEYALERLAKKAAKERNEDE